MDVLNSLVSSAPIENEDALGKRILHACQVIRSSRGTFQTVRESIIKYAHESIDSGGENLEHLL